MATNLPAVKDDVFALPQEMAEYVLPEYDYDKHSAGVGQVIGIVKWRKDMWFRELGKNSLLHTDEKGKPEKTIQFIIVDTHPGKTRTFYDYRVDFKEGERRKPDCSSDDGIIPRADGMAVQAARCAECPMAQWNSSRGGQRGGKACKEYKTIAVLPYFDVENEAFNGPMMLRIPPDSLRNWDELADRFRRNGAQFHNYVVEFAFDPMVPHPKMTFEVLGAADPSIMPQVMQWLGSEHLQNVLRYKPDAATIEELDPEYVANEAPSQAPPPKRTTPSPAPVATARPNPATTTRTPPPPPAANTPKAPPRTAPPPAQVASTRPPAPPRPGIPTQSPPPSASAVPSKAAPPKPNGQTPRPLSAVEAAKKAYEEAMAAAAAVQAAEDAEEAAEVSDTAVSEEDMSTDDILSVLDEEAI